MKAVRVLGVICSCVLLLAAAPPHNQIYGFTVQNSDAEFTLEDRFLDIPSSAGALDVGTALASQPHYAGSAGDYKLALYVRDRFKEFGFDTSIETLTARIDVPKKLALELIPSGFRGGRQGRAGASSGRFPSYFSITRRYRSTPTPGPDAAPAAPIGIPAQPVAKLDLRELPDPNDPDTANPAVGLPFIAGSADGDLTAPLVYAAHGMPADYAQLDAHSVDTHGAVILIRYGGDARGSLVRRAQLHGAVGVLLYDDPADDGAARGTVYPNGPWRPLTSVQRGSVGEGVTVPVLPISAANARLLLAALRGTNGPRPAWAGSMAVNYPYARGPAAVHLTVEMQRKTTTLWNTVGILHGSLPGQELILGAQRDAWVYGLGAGGGGTVTLIEAARGLGYLAKTGWVPGRTIVVAAWDGEELGSYGSLAYLKRHGDEIRDTSIAYLNTEPSVTGPVFGADAVAAIAPTIVEASHVVPDPVRQGQTIYERYAFRNGGALPGINRFNSVVDRNPFLFGSGTPTASASFTGPFGVYHSSYDTLQYARTISDPEFDLHRAAAQIYGVAALRLADADVIPYHFLAYVAPMESALRSLAALARARHMNLDVRNFNLTIRRFGANAARSDAATQRVANGDSAEQKLEAARILDLTAYGIEGETGITFPDVARALREGDQAAADLAVARARTTLDRSGALISH